MVTDRELVKLKEDLDRWVAQGVISPGRRDAILAEFTAQPAKARRGGLSFMPFVLGVLIAAGVAVLAVGLSEPAFIPRPVALLVLMASVTSALLLAQFLSSRDRPIASEIMVVMATGLFSASLFLITQVYFIHIHQPDLVLLAAAGAMLAAIILPSRGALAAAVVAGTIWSLMETFDYRTVFHWPYLALWIIAFGWAIRTRWLPGVHLCAAGLLCWLSINAFTGAQLLTWGPLDVLGLGIIASTALWVTGRYLENRSFPFPRTLEYYGLALALVTVFMLRFYLQYQAPYPVWQMFAGFSALTVIAVAFNALQRDRGALYMVIALLLFALVYPNIAPSLYEGLFLIQHASFVLLTLWVILHGIQLRDSAVVAIGLGGGCAEIVQFYASATGALPGDNVLIGLGVALAIICLAAAFTVHRTIFKDGRQSKGGPS